MKKVLQKIKSFILGVLGCIFFAFAISVTVLLLNYNKYGLTQFGNTTLVMVSDYITSDTLKKGDLVLVKSVLYFLSAILHANFLIFSSRHLVASPFKFFLISFAIAVDKTLASVLG